MKAVLASVLALGVALAVSMVSFAKEAEEVSDGFEPDHKVVIQVSTADPKVHALALSNAVNLQKHYGIDNIAIEIVAYGPGLSIFTKQSTVLERVTSLIVEDVTFTACGNTMDTIARNTGKQPELIEGVGKVQTGLARIIELQEQGYSYVRP